MVVSADAAPVTPGCPRLPRLPRLLCASLEKVPPGYADANVLLLDLVRLVCRKLTPVLLPAVDLLRRQQSHLPRRSRRWSRRRSRWRDSGRGLVVGAVGVHEYDEAFVCAATNLPVVVLGQSPSFAMLGVLAPRPRGNNNARGASPPSLSRICTCGPRCSGADQYHWAQRCGAPS